MTYSAGTAGRAPYLIWIRRVIAANLGVAVDASGAVYYIGSFHNMASVGGDPLTAAGTDFNGALVNYRP